MEHIVENKTTVWKLFNYFALFTMLGTALSILYVFVLPYVIDIQFKLFIIIFYFALLCILTGFLIKKLKVSPSKGAIIATCCGLIIINYIKWNFYFILTFLRWDFEVYILYDTIYSLITPQWFIERLVFINENLNYVYSTNHSDTLVPNLLIWLIWGIELFFIVSIPIHTCLNNTEIYIKDPQKTIQPIFLEYYFSTFDKETISKITEKDISVIVSQPAVTGTLKKSYWRVACFTLDGGNYEYIAVYKNSILGTRKKTPLIYIGNDLFKQLQLELYEKHFGNSTVI